MAHEDLTINGLSFIDAHLQVEGAPVFDPDLFLEAFFNGTLFHTNTNLRTELNDTYHELSFQFTDWDDLKAVMSTLSGLTPTEVEDIFIYEYKIRIGAGTLLSNVDDPPAFLFDSLSGLVTAQDIRDQFANAMNHFLSTYEYNEINEFYPGGRIFGEDAFAPDSFAKKWAAFVPTYTLDAPVSSSYPISYKSVWLAFGLDEADFQQTLENFYNGMLAKTGDGDPSKGWFIPAQHFQDWMNVVHNQFSSLGDIQRPNETLIINEILALLVDTIGVVQRITATQAERLKFLTSWQKAYTERLDSLPYFSAGGPVEDSPVGGSGSAETASRQSANEEIQLAQTKIRARRDAVSDEAKQLQTAINQSQDAANQQVNIASTLLQQLSSLISQIFR